MHLSSIASGSSGNSIYVGNNNTGFLVDTGISKKRIVEGLKAFGISPDEIRGVFITHEHSDHTSGLGVFMRKYKIPVFATGKTIDAILASGSLGKVDTSLFCSIDKDRPFEFEGIRVEASTTYHDAADPVCYTFKDEESKAGIATDFGTFDDYLVEKFDGCRDILVEANHDLNMLMVGPYPYPLKRRIMGNYGHLSNERAGHFLTKIIGSGCRNILLGHLSQHNNYPELAYETVKSELVMHNLNLKELGITLRVARRDTPTI